MLDLNELQKRGCQMFIRAQAVLEENLENADPLVRADAAHKILDLEIRLGANYAAAVQENLQAPTVERGH